MQEFAVVYFPKISLEKINSFREKYDPNWHIISPHITIVSPLSKVSESQLVKHVEKVTKDIESFSIRLTGLTKTFDDYLFLLVKEGNKKIFHLHDKLYSEILIPYMPIDYPFAPHITLGFFRTKNDTLDDKLFDMAYKEAQDHNFDITCSFDILSVIKGNGVSPAEIVKTINLQS